MTPFLATSIMPPEKNVPNINPAPATHKIAFRDETRDPMAELRKLTASFDTPTIRCKNAIIDNKITKIQINNIILND